MTIYWKLTSDEFLGVAATFKLDANIFKLYIFHL